MFPRRRSIASAAAIALLACASGCDPLLTLLAPLGAVGAPRSTGPYLQLEQADAVTVSWFTLLPLPGTLEVMDVTDAALPMRTFTENAAARHHAIRIDAFAAGHAYQYRLTGPAATDTEWHTLPTPKSAGQPVVFAILGDSGVGLPDQYAVANQIAASDADYVLHAGDVVYPAGADFAYDLTVFLPNSAFLATKPLLPCIGNHDVATLDGAAYLENFLLPRNGPIGVTPERCYSIDLGDVHLVSIDRTRDALTMAATIIPWLRADLAASAARWKIVLFHYPLYTSGTASRPSDPVLNALWGGVFDDLGVDFCIAGHNHFYERSQPIRGGEVVAPGQGTVYLVCGDGGAPLYALSPRASYSAASNDQIHGFTRLAFNAGHVELTHVDMNGQTLDQTNWDK